MHWKHQFDAIIRPYYQETQHEQSLSHEAAPTPSQLCSVSQDADGTSYRVCLDGNDPLPTLWIVVPQTRSSPHLTIFRVSLTPQTAFAQRLLELLPLLQGSPQLQAIQPFWHASMAEMLGDVLKILFWQGSMEDLRFPPEITVTQEGS